MEALNLQLKDTPLWQMVYKELKEALSIREHLPKGKEAKEIRLKRNKRQKTFEKEAEHSQKRERSFNIE